MEANILPDEILPDEKPNLVEASPIDSGLTGPIYNLRLVACRSMSPCSHPRPGARQVFTPELGEKTTATFSTYYA